MGLHLEELEAREVPAAIGALDPSFGAGGKVIANGAPLTDVALQPDGRIVTVGTANGNFFIARLNPDGNLDTTFDTEGLVAIDFGGTDRAIGVAIQPDGKIVIVGSTTNGTNIAVARLTTTGALDTTFDGDGRTTIDLGGTETANDVAIQSDGKIVIAGTNGPDFAAIRLNANGSLDGTFDGDGKKTIDLTGPADAANALAIQPNGKIVLAGTNGTNFAMVRLNGADGSMDNTFDSDGKFAFDMGGTDIARSVAIQSNGSIVIVGSNGSDMAIARLLPNGAFDTGFSGDGKQTVNLSGADDARAVQIQSDGRILVVGDTGNNASDTAIVRLTASGALDTTFKGTGKDSFDVSGSSFLDLGMAAALTPQGRLVIVGQGGGGQVNGAILRVPVELEDPDGLAIGGTLNGLGTVYKPNPATGQFTPVPTPITVFGAATVSARTATGDVNGDGVEDTVLVTGPGTAIRIAVVSGVDNSTRLVSPFDPFGGGFTGGGFVSTADFDNDGRSEFVVTPDQGGGPRVSIFSLAADGTLVRRANFFGIDDPNFRGGARTAAGDVNGDGRADLAVAAGFQGGPRVALFNGASGFSTPTRLINDFFAFEPGLRNGAFITIGDTNGDGYGDLYFGAGPGGAPRVLGISGQMLMSSGAVEAIAAPLSNFFLAGNTANRGGVRLASADADGDGLADVVAGTGDGQASFARVYLGQDLSVGGEPAEFQDLNPFAGAILKNGIFVG